MKWTLVILMLVLTPICNIVIRFTPQQKGPSQEWVPSGHHLAEVKPGDNKDYELTGVDAIAEENSHFYWGTKVIKVVGLGYCRWIVSDGSDKWDGFIDTEACTMPQDPLSGLSDEEVQAACQKPVGNWVSVGDKATLRDATGRPLVEVEFVEEHIAILSYGDHSMFVYSTGQLLFKNSQGVITTLYLGCDGNIYHPEDQPLIIPPDFQIG